MRIAIVGPTYPFKGGIAAHTTELAHRLAAEGHDVVIESWSSQYPAFIYPGGRQTVEPLEGVPFDAVRSTMSWARPDSWWRVGRRLADQDLVVLTIVTSLQAPPYLLLLRGLRGARTVALCHNVLPHERRSVDERLVSSILRRVDTVLVHSAEQAALARRFTGRPVRAAMLAPHGPATGVTAARLADRAGAEPALATGGVGAEPRQPAEQCPPVEQCPPAEFEPPPVRRRLLFFGTVRPYKGLDVLLRALAVVPDVSLLVAGEFWGGSRDAERLVAELGLADRVTLRPGYVPVESVPELFGPVDALVLPYRSATASQNAWIAFEHGVPVISTRAGTLAEQVTDGVDGVLAEPDDVADLAAALRRFYAPGMPERLRAAVKPFDGEPVWERYLAVLLGSG